MTLSIFVDMNVKEQIKNTGATFTPKGLADFLANEISNYLNCEKYVNVLDPSCGEGELLLAMKNVLEEKQIKFSLSGYDTNNKYLSITANRLDSFHSEHLKLKEADFLEAVDLTQNQLSLGFDQSKDVNLVNCSADIIIANPPYVRTQILGSEKAQMLAKKFRLKGRVDLYYPFLMAMTESLKVGGILGVITSNRYLSTKGGESIRKYLVDNYEILKVIDLGDTKLFDAAVLPAIFIGRKKDAENGTLNETKFIKIYEELNGYKGDLKSTDDIYDVLKNEDSGYFQTGEVRYKKTDGFLKYESRLGSPWQMLSKLETKWAIKIDQNSKNRVGDFFKVRVGIKTTADKVFINDNWDHLGEGKPEEELLKDLISQENIDRWSVNDKVSLRVLYTHVVKENKKQVIDIDKYPKAKKYFLSHEEQLKGRKYVINAGRTWYEIWVPQNPSSWDKPKLVFPDISVTPRFYFDKGGKIVNGNCYWIVAEKESDVDKLLLIQGIANSKLMTKYHDLVFNNKLYSGRRRYFSQYVEQYPLPNFESNESREIIKIVTELNKNENSKETQLLELKLEKAVAKAFGVSTVLTLD